MVTNSNDYLRCITGCKFIFGIATIWFTNKVCFICFQNLEFICCCLPCPGRFSLTITKLKRNIAIGTKFALILIHKIRKC